MTIEQTFVLMKPDAVQMGCVDAIRAIYILAGFRVVHERPVRFSREEAMELYEEHAGNFYFPALLLAMTGHLCRGLVLEGENAIEEVRKLNGPTDPSKALKGTIRGDFRSGGGPYNTVHSSDSPESFGHEVRIFLLASGSDVVIIASDSDAVCISECKPAVHK